MAATEVATESFKRSAGARSKEEIWGRGTPGLQQIPKIPGPQSPQNATWRVQPKVRISKRKRARRLDGPWRRSSRARRPRKSGPKGRGVTAQPAADGEIGPRVQWGRRSKLRANRLGSGHTESARGARQHRIDRNRPKMPKSAPIGQEIGQDHAKISKIWALST